MKCTSFRPLLPVLGAFGCSNPSHVVAPRVGRRTLAGLSMIELMIALGLGSLVLAAVGSLSLFGTRSSLAIVNYTDLDSKSRYALDVIGREVRQATAVLAIQTNAAATEYIRLTNAVQGVTVQITYSPNARTVTLSKTGQADQVLLAQCDQWNLGLYQRTPWITSTNILFYPSTNATGVLDLSVCKLVSLSWKCSRQILAQKVNTESVQAAQLVLRNKQ
ncbi:MAG TPA: hypothetical protein VG167_01615 [Verrucomicrobiae bacterium]|nr:hypothetical protein [Verrucomicrobiae bacterium]